MRWTKEQISEQPSLFPLQMQLGVSGNKEKMQREQEALRK